MSLIPPTTDDAAAAPTQPNSLSWVAELRRLRSLYTLDLHGDTADAQRFDRFGRIAATVFAVPVALVTVLDDDHQWFCAAVGTDLDGNVRNESFCTRLIDDDRSLFVVEDTQLNDRYVDLPIVCNAPFIRFYAGASISTPDGQRIGSLCILDVEPRSFDDEQRRVLRDLADLIENEIQHLRLALTDELTQLSNRRAFTTAAKRYMALGMRRNDPVSVVFCDIDGLKAVNDNLGHQAGDELLRKAAAALTAGIRSIDLVARLGGDEFTIVLYDADEAAAVRTVERLRHAVAASNRGADGAPLSVSFGTATSTSGETLTELVDRADEAMYEGRRRRGADQTAG